MSPDPIHGGLVFEPARASDVSALVSIDRSSPVPWTAGHFDEEIRRRPPTVFVLRTEGQTVAFVVARLLPPELDIVNVAVQAVRRQQGLGRRIVEGLLEQAAQGGARTAFLEVREGNEPARRLYQSLGFRETQRRPAFYKDPIEAAVLMSREIGI